MQTLADAFSKTKKNLKNCVLFNRVFCHRHTRSLLRICKLLYTHAVTQLHIYLSHFGAFLFTNLHATTCLYLFFAIDIPRLFNKRSFFFHVYCVSNEQQVEIECARQEYIWVLLLSVSLSMCVPCASYFVIFLSAEKEILLIECAKISKADYVCFAVNNKQNKFFIYV